MGEFLDALGERGIGLARLRRGGGSEVSTGRSWIDDQGRGAKSVRSFCWINRFRMPIGIATMSTEQEDKWFEIVI